MTPLMYIAAIVMYIIWVHQNYTRGSIGLYLICIGVNTFVGYYITAGIMVNTPGALKYIDPYWDKVERGLYFYPSILYALGLANNQKVQQEPYFPGKVLEENEMKDGT